MIDKILIFIGVIGAFSAAAMYPIVFFLYGEIASSFVDHEVFKNEYKFISRNSSWSFTLYF